jgi:hypothetical protein
MPKPTTPNQIWIPTSSTKATVKDGIVTTWHEMNFQLKPITRPDIGFNK